jgi:hypothetical protein
MPEQQNIEYKQSWHIATWGLNLLICAKKQAYSNPK